MWISLEKISVFVKNYKAKHPESTSTPTLASIFEKVLHDLNLVIISKDANRLMLQPAKVANNAAVPTQFIVHVNKKLNTKEVKLLDFRLSKGCGMDFKRHFVAIHAAMKKFIVSDRDLGF